MNLNDLPDLVIGWCWLHYKAVFWGVVLFLIVSFVVKAAKESFKEEFGEELNPAGIRKTYRKLKQKAWDEAGAKEQQKQSK